MKRTTRNAIVLAALAALLATPLLAAPAHGPRGNWGDCDGTGPHGPRGGGLGGPMMGICRQLDLTDGQREQLHATVTRAMEEGLGDLLRARREARRQTRLLIHDPKADEAAILDALRAGAGADEQVALERHRLTVALFEILTEEQRVQALELLRATPDTTRPMRRHGRFGPPSGE